MKRALALAGGGLLAAAIGWQAIALQTESVPDPMVTPEPAVASPTEDAPAAAAPRRRSEPATPPASRAETPMAERVAVIGLLNKRNGLWRDLTMKPGQAQRVGDVIVRLRACETTAPWEAEQLTGAFVQTDIRGRDGKWRRAFSGWLYKESPSLNVVEHPIYDVWPKSCTMRHPDIGPDTLPASLPGASPSRRSSAPKSADTETPDGPTPSAESSNAT